MASNMPARCLLSSSSLPLQPLRATTRRQLAWQVRHDQIPHRHASTTPSGTDSLLLSRLKTFLFATAAGTTLYAVYLYTTDTRAALHRHIIPPLLRLLLPDAETAHHAGTTTLHALYTLGLHPRDRTPDAPKLATHAFPAIPLTNPLGISAGLDKDAQIPDALFALGAAVVEVGGVTPRPQRGNPRPRVWRVPSADALVNRYGLNGLGADAVAARLRARLRRFAAARGLAEGDVLGGRAGVPPGSLLPGRVLAVQVAKGRETDERDVRAVVADYVYCVRRLGVYADVLVVNVSSPNTPGLRDLQAVEPLTQLLSAVVEEAGRAVGMGRRERPKVMVKVSPDENEDYQVEGICRAVWESGVDGVVVGNTTKRRTGLVPEGVVLGAREQRALMETGGFSGPATFDRTLELVGRYRKLLDNQSFREGGSSPGVAAVPSLPAVDGIVSTAESTRRNSAEQKVIFASGGITNGRQALEVLNAGATVAMIYTGMVYGGAGTVTRMKKEMVEGIHHGAAGRTANMAP